MKSTIKITVLAFCIASGATSAHQRHSIHDMRAMMRHANPTPNLMMVVIRHSSQLNLTQEQSESLANWRNANHQPMLALVKEIHQIEKAIFDASMSGKSKEEIMNLTPKLFALRKELISTKIDCRDFMRSILSEEQLAKVMNLYHRM